MLSVQNFVKKISHFEFGCNIKIFLYRRTGPLESSIFKAAKKCKNGVKNNTTDNTALFPPRARFRRSRSVPRALHVLMAYRDAGAVRSPASNITVVPSIAFLGVQMSRNFRTLPLRTAHVVVCFLHTSDCHTSQNTSALEIAND